MQIRGIRPFDIRGERPRIVSFRPKPKTAKHKFFLTPSMFIFLIVALIFAYSAAKNYFLTFLSNPISAGNILIIPENFKAEFPLKYGWKSIKILSVGAAEDSSAATILISNPKISINLRLSSRGELLNVSMDSVYAKIALPNNDSLAENEDTAQDLQIKHLRHPDIYLPFRIAVSINNIAVNVEIPGQADSSKEKSYSAQNYSWGLDSLKIVKSGRQKRFRINAQNIHGSQLASALFLNADYRWNEMFSDLSIKISNGDAAESAIDSLTISLNAPRDQLEDLSAEIFASIKNLPFWFCGKYPEGAPNVENVALHTNAAFNILNGKIDFNLNLSSKIGELWQLPKFNANIQLSGNGNGISYSEISLLGENGEKIKFNGNINKNLDGNGALEVSKINIELGGETLPTDVKFHQISKKGNALSAIFTTKAGSNFNAKMADLNDPTITFTADIAPEEPWAVQWCQGNLKLARPTLINGSFSFNDVLLKANVKTKVPFAYYAAADEFEVDLWLDPEGIHFPKGTIKRNGYVSDFTGKVMWDEEYLTFKLNQRNAESAAGESAGEAETYITFNPKMDLYLKNINTQTLPFADLQMLKGYNGIVSGQWIYDIEHSIGSASLEVAAMIKELGVKAKSDVEILGDSLTIKNFELEQNNKKISAFLLALTPNKNRPSRKDFEIQEAGINIPPNMDLVSIAAAFGDSTLKSGFADGKIEYGIKEGLDGTLNFSELALRSLDTTQFIIPKIKLETFKNSAKFSGHIILGDGLWNGDLELSISKPSARSELPVSLLYAANSSGDSGTFKFDGMLGRNFNNLSGEISITGDWFLPSGIGEIKNSNVEISMKLPWGENIIDSLTASFVSKGSVYEKEFLQLPVNFYGRIAKGILLVDSAFVFGEDNEKITAKMKMGLENAELKDLTFSTEQFTMIIQKEHKIQIKNSFGKTELDSSGVSVFAQFPSIFYQLKSDDYGNAEATIKGGMEYRIPFQEGTIQTNASITGHFDIDKALYSKEIDLIPDPLHLDKTLSTLNKFVTSTLSEKGSGDSHARAGGRPTNLNIKINTSGMRSATISSNVANFPFAVNLSVLGTTKNILLSGDINTVGNGKIGYQGLTMFDLSFFRLYWQNSPWKQGMVELRASNNYPFCTDPNSANGETCTVNLDLEGTFAKLNLEPTTNCSIEASPALIYYSMMLGCISEDYQTGSAFDKNKFTGRMIGKLMSSTVNRGFGKNIVGDIDFNMPIFEQEKLERDSSYIRVPISLSRWVSNLDAVFGYTADESIDPRYDHSFEAGLRYKLPIFDSTDINKNLIDPSLDVNTNLVARFYKGTLESGQDEGRLEKNVGLLYSHKFWDPCILGIGKCNVD